MMRDTDTNKTVELQKLEAQLYSRIPFIGRWLRQRAVNTLAAFALEGDSQAVRILAEVVAHSHDVTVQGIAFNVLSRLTNQDGIDAVCKVWAQTRHTKLATLLLTGDWVASTPTNLVVLTALKTGQVESIIQGAPVIVDPLVKACVDADPEIDERARGCLVGLRNAAAINELCGRADVVELLAQLYKTSPPKFARQALTYLLNLRHPQAVETLCAREDAVELFGHACLDADPDVAQKASLYLRSLQNQPAIDVFCQRWFVTRSPVFTQILRQAGYVASQPVEVTVFSALQTEQLNVIRVARVDMIAPLVLACEDSDPLIAKHAQFVIRQRITDFNIQEMVARLAIEHEYPAVQEMLLHEGGAAFVSVLLNASQKDDPAITERARKLLTQLKTPEAVEAVCRQLIAQEYPLAQEIAIACQYAPREPSRRALFYFVTEQWEQYETLDFDQSLLKAEYEAADETLRKRIAEIARQAGRVEWAELIVARRHEDLTDEEWQTTLTVLARNERWERIWRLAQEAPLVWSVRFLQQLQAMAWQPQKIEEQATFVELTRLAAKCTEEPFETVGTGFQQKPSRLKKTSKDWPDLQHAALEKSPKSVRCLAICPDGSLLASGRGQKDNTVRLWSLPDGKVVKILETHPAAVTCLAFSPDGQFLATGSFKSIHIWRLPEGKEALRLKGHANWLRSLVFTPDGRTLISGSQDSTIRFWSLPDGREVNILEGHSDWVNCFAVSSDGQLLVSGSDDRTVRLWQLHEGTLLKTLEGHTGHVKRVALSPGGNIVVSGSDDDVRLWLVPQGTLLKILKPRPNWLQSFAISPDGRLLAYWSSQKTVRVWRLEPLFLMKYLSTTQINPQDIAWLRESVQYEKRSEIECHWLEFILALTHWTRRFDIEVEESRPTIPFGEFDIEIDS